MYTIYLLPETMKHLSFKRIKENATSMGACLSILVSALLRLASSCVIAAAVNGRVNGRANGSVDGSSEFRDDDHGHGYDYGDSVESWDLALWNCAASLARFEVLFTITASLAVGSAKKPCSLSCLTWPSIPASSNALANLLL